MTTYSTIWDVRNFGVSADEASDDLVKMALAVAKIRINKYCGNASDFGTLVSRTVIKDEVGGYDVHLPAFTPGSITAVQVADITLASTDYEERPYGIRLVRGRLFDIDGFLLFPDSPVANSAFRQRGSVKVEVTATFGTDIDEQIALASTILASQVALQRADDNMLPAAITSFMTEEIKIAAARPVGFSTGNYEVDLMLDDYQDGGALIG